MTESKQKKKKIFRGERLQQIRDERDLTQAALSELIGVEEYTVSRYETQAQQPSYETLVALCQELNVSADYLLGIVEERYLLHPIQYKEVKTLPETKTIEKAPPTERALTDLNARQLAETLAAVKLLERFTERSLAYERGFNYKTKRFLELWSQLSESEKAASLQELEAKLAAPEEKEE